MIWGLDWYLRPIVSGHYPDIMVDTVADRLPAFKPHESAMLKGSYDVLMLNHYSSKIVTDCASPTSTKPCSDLGPGVPTDMQVDDSQFPEGARLASVSPKTGKRNCDWFSGYPQGYGDVIRYMHEFDKQADILLTENGWCGNSTIENYDQLWYYQTYLDQVWQALQEGIPIIGYTAWSFMDNYEWGSFEPRFGLYYVDFPEQTGSKEGFVPRADELKRIPRPAAKWLAQVAKSGCLDTVNEAATPIAPKKSGSSGPSSHSVGSNPQGHDMTSSDSTPHWGTTVMVVAGFAVVLMLFSILRCCCCKKKKATSGPIVGENTALLNNRN